jgi:hypothetical protein
MYNSVATNENGHDPTTRQRQKPKRRSRPEMNLSNTPNYGDLRATRSFLRVAAHVARIVLGLLGVVLFFQRAATLLGTGFGLGERVVIGLLALGYLGGFGLAAVLAHRLLLAAGDLVDVLVDHAVAGQRALWVLENDLIPATNRLTQAVKSLSKNKARAQPADLGALATSELIEQLTLAKRSADPDEALDVRAALVGRLSAEHAQTLDRQLAQWLSNHFLRALRAGKAPIVAGAWGRAVQELPDIPEMKHLRESLPTVRRSAGLCISCGRPYRGTSGRCPTCQQKNGDKS